MSRRSTTSSPRTPARPRRSTACKAALRKDLEDKEREVDRSRGARGRAARADQEEPDPGRVVARRPRGRDAVPAPPPDARHEARRATRQIPDDLRDKMQPAGADEVRGQLLLEAIADKEARHGHRRGARQAHRADREGAQHAAREAARRVAARRPPRQRHLLAAPGQGAASSSSTTRRSPRSRS